MLAAVEARRLVKEARRRAGLTQAQLAERVGTTQSAIARLEAGGTEPSLSRVDVLIRACGLSLAVELDDRPPVDPDEWDRALRNLDLSVEERLQNVVAAARFIAAGRRSRAVR